MCDKNIVFKICICVVYYYIIVLYIYYDLKFLYSKVLNIHKTITHYYSFNIYYQYIDINIIICIYYKKVYYRYDNYCVKNYLIKTNKFYFPSNINARLACAIYFKSFKAFHGMYNTNCHSSWQSRRYDNRVNIQTSYYNILHRSLYPKQKTK